MRQALHTLDIPTLHVAPIQGKTDIQGIIRHLACFKARAPHIVHFNLSNPLHGQYAMLAARLARVPVKMATLHLPPRSTTPTKRGRFFERQTLCKLDMLIAVCQASQDLMITHFGIDSKHTTAIYNGIDLADFDQAVLNEAPIQLKKETDLLIGTVGRLSPQKGFDVLLNSMPKILQKVPQARLFIAGEGPEEGALKALCKSLNIEKQVNFLGMRPDIPALLQAFDLFVLPSRYESFPISILEVMAASKPIVSTLVDGIPESICHGKTGLLVPPEDVDALAQAITTLLQDAPLRIKMSAQARQRVESHFTLHQMAQKTQAIYHQLSS